jgi:hypothetical protein
MMIGGRFHFGAGVDSFSLGAVAENSVVSLLRTKEFCEIAGDRLSPARSCRM